MNDAAFISHAAEKLFDKVDEIDWKVLSLLIGTLIKIKDVEILQSQEYIKLTNLIANSFTKLLKSNTFQRPNLHTLLMVTSFC